jgi:hypothetical protein
MAGTIVEDLGSMVLCRRNATSYYYYASSNRSQWEYVLMKKEEVISGKTIPAKYNVQGQQEPEKKT